MKLERSDRGPLWAFLGPAIVLMVAFFVIPVVYVAVVSILKWNGISTPAFNSLRNYLMLFKDKAFTRSILNNVIWALVAGFIQVPLAMVMAIILSRKPKRSTSSPRSFPASRWPRCGARSTTPTPACSTAF